MSVQVVKVVKGFYALVRSEFEDAETEGDYVTFGARMQHAHSRFVIVKWIVVARARV